MVLFLDDFEVTLAPRKVERLEFALVDELKNWQWWFSTLALSKTAYFAFVAVIGYELSYTSNFWPAYRKNLGAVAKK